MYIVNNVMEKCITLNIVLNAYVFDDATSAQKVKQLHTYICQIDNCENQF